LNTDILKHVIQPYKEKQLTLWKNITNIPIILKKKNCNTLKTELEKYINEQKQKPQNDKNNKNDDDDMEYITLYDSSNTEKTLYNLSDINNHLPEKYQIKLNLYTKNKEFLYTIQILIKLKNKTIYAFFPEKTGKKPTAFKLQSLTDASFFSFHKENNVAVDLGVEHKENTVPKEKHEIVHPDKDILKNLKSTFSDENFAKEIFYDIKQLQKGNEGSVSYSNFLEFMYQNQIYHPLSTIIPIYTSTKKNLGKTHTLDIHDKNNQKNNRDVINSYAKKIKDINSRKLRLNGPRVTHED
jgi:hypothetical protein